MFRLIASALVLATTLSISTASHASMFGGHAGSASTAKVKMVKMILRNRTEVPMNLMIEDKPVTIAANGEYELKAAEGTHVYGEDKSVKLLVTRDLDGTTCSFR